MNFGYARTSTTDQVTGLDDQVAALEKAGCKRVYKEHVSGAASRRERLERLMERLEAGDTLTVTKMDRLARNVRQLLEIVEDLQGRGVAVRILDFNGDTVDTKTSTGKLMLTMFGAFAEFERSVVLERQRIGIDAAKGDKTKYPGRKPTAMGKRDKIVKLDAEGMTRTAIAKELGVSERSVYRALQGTGEPIG
ncbi:recombinase family protein [Mesorhizobium sp. M0808]|uniref:recombinase family protein n=1 Tax=unclassified Mesorhizobium TaxID=325217 RepID=UPI003339572F